MAQLKHSIADPKSLRTTYNSRINDLESATGYDRKFSPGINCATAGLSVQSGAHSRKYRITSFDAPVDEGFLRNFSRRKIVSRPSLDVIAQPGARRCVKLCPEILRYGILQLARITEQLPFKMSPD